MNTSNSCPAEPTDHGRDDHGRFTLGNRGGPGNPYARRVARLRSIIVECLTDEAMYEIVDQLVVVARLGNMTAIKFLFQYALGKPAPVQADPDKVDLQEIEMMKQAPTVTECSNTATKHYPPDRVLDMMRCTQAAGGEAIAEMMLDGLGEIEERDAAAEERENPEPTQPQPPRPKAPPSPNRETHAAAEQRHGMSPNDKRPPFSTRGQRRNGRRLEPQPMRQ